MGVSAPVGRRRDRPEAVPDGHRAPAVPDGPVGAEVVPAERVEPDDRRVEPDELRVGALVVLVVPGDPPADGRVPLAAPVARVERAVRAGPARREPPEEVGPAVVGDPNGRPVLIAP